VDSFEAELQACLPDLWRYGYALTRNRDAADDLVQDCAERALNKRSQWREQGALKPWLMKILLNIYRNQKRSLSRRPELVAVDNTDLSWMPVSSDPYASHIALCEIARSLQKLPEEQREALLLVVLTGLSYREAAETLEIPIGTLMSRLGRARISLRVARDGYSSDSPTIQPSST